MSPAETTIGLIALAGVLAFVVRMFSRDEQRSSSDARPDDVDALLAEASASDAATTGETVAITSDGWAFVPDGDEVQLIPPVDHEDEAPYREPASPSGLPAGPPIAQEGAMIPLAARRSHAHRPGEHLDSGDLVGARVRRGAPDFDPWRLEAIGRDGEYRAWFFETKDAADTALDLLEARIVRVPRDEDGEPRPVSDTDYEEARRRDEETERALDQPDE